MQHAREEGWELYMELKVCHEDRAKVEAWEKEAIGELIEKGYQLTNMEGMYDPVKLWLDVNMPHQKRDVDPRHDAHVLEFKRIV